MIDALASVTFLLVVIFAMVTLANWDDVRDYWRGFWKDVHGQR